MFEEIESILCQELKEAAQQLARTAFKGFISKFLPKSDIESFFENYAERYYHRHGRIASLGISQPVCLYKLFASVHVVPADFLSSFREQRELEDILANSGSFASLFPGREDWLRVMNAHSLLNLLGAPGSGKTTLLKRLGLEALLSNNKIERDGLRGNYGYSLLPVYIELRKLRADDRNLRAVIADELKVCGLQKADELVEHALRERKFLLLLDGLDEIPGKRVQEVIEHIRDFVDQFSGNRFVISCRTAFYRSYFRCTNVVMADLEDSQIRAVAENWFSSERARKEHAADRFCSSLFDSKNRKTLELARTPLLLNFLCLTYGKTLRFPANRAQLYYRALDILLEEWAAEKLVHEGELYEGFTSEMEMTLLGQIALEGFESNKYFFSGRMLQSRISGYLQDEIKARQLDWKQVIDAIQVQQGLLVKRAEDAYSFCHPTIQEYLAAYYICDDRELLAEAIKKHASDSRWKEIFLLAAGLGVREEVSAIVEGIAVEGAKVINENRKLKSVVSAIGDVVQVSDDRPTVQAAKRFFMLGLVCMLDLGFAVSTAMANDLGSAIIRVRGLKRARRLSLAIAVKIDPEMGKLFAEGVLSFNLARKIDIDIDRAIHYAVDEERDLDAELLMEIVDGARKYGIIDNARCERTKGVVRLGQWRDDGSSFRSALVRLDKRFELTELEFDDREKLNRYLYLVNMAVECQNVATTGSRVMWDDVVRSLL